MKLNIVIPYYNTKEYTDELLDRLAPQITDDVRVIVVDDGSDEKYTSKYAPLKWCLVINEAENYGQAYARNVGLAYDSDYVQFIDSDDMVAEDFVARIIEKIDTEHPDIIEFSWKSLTKNGVQFDYKLKQGERLKNPSACTRTFSKEFIGDQRFNINKDACEDEEFTRKLGIFRKSLKVSVISDYMYFYRTEVAGSNTKDYKAGLKHTKRVVYYYEHVTADNTELLEEIKKEDIHNEVILMTNQCDIPEMEVYAQVMKPIRTWTHILRGEPISIVTVIPLPIHHDVILYAKNLSPIGGIETFIYHLGKSMRRDMCLVVDMMPKEQENRIAEVIPVYKLDPARRYNCNTLVMVRLLDTIPTNISHVRSVRTVHACRTNPQWHIPQDTDFVVNVSQASKDSFGDEAKDAIVIHNPITWSDKKSLMLISATRIPAPDKGNNVNRMIRLADMLEEAGIDFVWLNFSSGAVPHRRIANVGTHMDMQPFIAKCDYLVQLSDSEAWSYSILEALTQNVPVIVCPFPSAKEMLIEDGKSGYIIPYDMDFDVRKLLRRPEFDYAYERGPIKSQWNKIFDGKLKPKRRKGVRVKITKEYYDVVLERIVRAGETLTVSSDRAEQLRKGGVA